MEEKKTVSEWIFEDIEENTYFRKIYNQMILEYVNMLFGEPYVLDRKVVAHLQRFADLLSKSDGTRSDFYKNIAQNIVCILEKLYPKDDINKIYLGSVLMNVNNYLGLSGKYSDYQNTDIVEGLVDVTVKEAYRLPKECGSNMFFDASQIIAFNKLKNNKYYSFSAPTSMGKTFLVKMFIKTLVVKGYHYNYVIVVPSKALINEVKSELINEMGSSLSDKNYKVITAPTAIADNSGQHYIMVYTQERLSYQIKIHNNINIDYVFIDEAQKISEIGIRSAFFYKIINCLINRNRETKIYFLCPYIPNPQVYLKLISNNHNKVYDIFEFSPVNQQKSIVDLKMREMHIYSDLTKEFLRKAMNFEGDSAMDFVYHVGENSSNIVFCDSKKSVETNAIAYWKKCKQDNNPKLRELIEEVKKDIHPKSFLVYFLEKGICCHVGYLPSTIKAKIESLFRDKVIKTIFCTSTLLEGVNLPAENLFIIVKNKSYILQKSADFKNLMGRVGRKTYNLIGNVYVIPEGGNVETIERCQELIESPVENQILSIDKVLSSKLKSDIIECLLNGTGTIDKGKMTYEIYGMARFVINILLKCILNRDENNYIYKLFSNELTEKELDIIREKFKNEDVNDDSNVTIDQVKNLDKAIIESGLKYPEKIDYANVKDFLEKLFDVFQWEKYEAKTDIGKKQKLAYYAVLLNQWMAGHSIRRIIDKSILHHKDTGKIYDEQKNIFVDYVGKNAQDNRIVIECLTAIEDVILFSISNYFTRFSERYKLLKKVDNLTNDWSEYIDFGTNDKLVIELQKIGFTREVAKIIEKEGLVAMDDFGSIIFTKDIFNYSSEELIRELEDVKLNYAELFMGL